MKKGLLFLFIFIAGIATTLIYQNCGGSSIDAKSSGKDGLPVDVSAGDGDGDGGNGGDGDGGNGGDGDGGNGGDGGGGSGTDIDHKYNVATGDTILFRNIGTANLSTSRFRKQLYYYFLDTHTYHADNATIANDLPDSYCEKSALPHCLHINEVTCQSIGCTQPSKQIVKCYRQKRLTNAQKDNIAAILNALKFDLRNVTAQDPTIAGCDNPKLFFYGSGNKSLELSLAAKSCVPDDKYFAVAGINGVSTLFNSEITSVTNKTDDCNLYSVYSWDKTKFTYKAQSGFTTAANAELREVTYIPPTDKKPVAKIRFKERGSTKTYCADKVFINPPELDVVFPAAGIPYSIYHTGAQLADGATTEISYQNATDGANKWQFFLNQTTAQAHRGGAILSEDQADDLKAMIQVLITRAKNLPPAEGGAKECNN